MIELPAGVLCSIYLFVGIVLGIIIGYYVNDRKDV